MGANTSRQTASTREILDAVRRIVQTLRASSRYAERRVGLSAAQLFVLHKLAETPAISLNDLAERTRTHQSSVSTVVSRLVTRGLVQRTQAQADGRRLELTLTPRGRRLVARAPEPAQESLIRSIERLAPGRRRLLASCLGELVSGMDAARAEVSMFFDDSARGAAALAPPPIARVSRTKTPPPGPAADETRRRRRARRA